MAPCNLNLFSRAEDKMQARFKVGITPRLPIRAPNYYRRPDTAFGAGLHRLPPTCELLKSQTTQKTMNIRTLILFLGVTVMGVKMQAQLTYTTNNGVITITGYSGPGGALTIPASYSGYPITSIGNGAFENCTSLTGITIPNSVTNIGESAFANCT